ncbi:PREDICTED: F-box protein At3g49510-like isoform X2 [Camelina sativa]|uniref:F-box protein At3g49510-like isoform X2 n=1 Tax=Camelina sativa TaxID=90675 RepID=A0ABM1QGF9_CAMSA|nr:PREDICTED: F-box protein At3g49510-like isoform X2 [Camelina sativa]
MTTISDLPDDLVGEIFSKVPLTSLSAVRSTCKKWEALSKNHIVGKKAASRSRQFLEFMVSGSDVWSLRFDLQGIRNEEDDLSDPSMKQINIPNTDQLEISQVYYCDGLLLCISITKDKSSLVVWNPYLGQTKWIRPGNKFDIFDKFALGYDNNHNHKILRFLDDDDVRSRRSQRSDTHVYDFSSDSWRVLDVNPDGDAPFYFSGVSSKGNSYFLGREIFGPRLPLPFDPSPDLKYTTLSWVRDEKLAVLNSHSDTFQICNIWVSTKIEPNAVSWSTFFTVDMSPVNGFQSGLSTYFPPWSFFIDEEKKVAVFFNNSETKTCRYQMAYIVGDDGYFKSVNIGEISNSQWNRGKLVCSSYVPSLVQLQV